MVRTKFLALGRILMVLAYRRNVEVRRLSMRIPDHAHLT